MLPTSLLTGSCVSCLRAHRPRTGLAARLLAVSAGLRTAGRRLCSAVLSALAAVLVALLGAVSVGAAAHAQTATLVPPTGLPPLKIGLIGPMSGGSSDFGTAMLRGVQMAVSEVNAVGGYLGRPIELVIRDDEGQPEAGLRASEQLLRTDRVVAAIGFCNTGVAIRAIPSFQAAQVPLIVPCAAGSPVTRQVPAPRSYVFRVSPSEDIKAPFIVADALRRGWTRMAILADDTPYGQSGRADVEQALARGGLKPVYAASFSIGVSDLRPQLEAAREAGAQVVIAYTVGPENAVIARGRADLRWNVPLMGPWTLSFPKFLEAAGPAAEGALTVQTFIAEPSNERRAAFLTAYRRMFGQSRLAVPMATAQAYDATYLLVYALLGIRDGQINGPAIKAQLENLERVHYGVVATYDRPFSADSKEAVTANMLVMGKVRRGAITFAYPEDAQRNLFVQRKQR